MKPEINYKIRAGKIRTIWRLNSMLLNNYQVNDKILKYPERNENMACHNQWKVAQAVLTVYRDTRPSQEIRKQ